MLQGNERATALNTISNLLEMVKAETAYEQEYEKAKAKAVKAAALNGHCSYWWDLMPIKYKNPPKSDSAVNRKLQVIRELCLDLYRKDDF